MEWLKEALANYDSLSKSEQAHVDAACDNLENNEDVCICGVKDCPEGYVHMTSGY